MTSTTSQLEKSLRELQISESDSQETSTVVRWVPSKYSSDVSQYVLVRPPRAPCGNRRLFGFPIVKREVWDIGTIAFKQIWPDETLPDDHFFIAMNSLTFIEIYLKLRVCTMARAKVVGDPKNIPPDCMSSGKVLLLVLWRDTESDEACPTPSQVHSLEVKLKRSPGWWVEVPVFFCCYVCWSRVQLTISFSALHTNFGQLTSEHFLTNVARFDGHGTDAGTSWHDLIRERECRARASARLQMVITVSALSLIFTAAIHIISIVAAKGLLIIRTYAFWQKNNKLLAVLLVWSCVLILIICIACAYHKQTLPLQTTTLFFKIPPQATVLLKRVAAVPFNIMAFSWPSNWGYQDYRDSDSPLVRAVFQGRVRFTVPAWWDKKLDTIVNN
ncbi:uncharacterized protein EDB93DRAFT_1107088 [Suillus bovinus]|uniref:uncharacterized protein n=1 Tax=Suillus bovinus TaxID=48563 RepID=UPI001B885455|nr:uncharacterized protein EDB93DRAFT_1107088 [Suillus bovinus]KAG2135738.1 hypothetical protein EDB93DRAFT_1107088 [Suillus bovinus]